MPSILPAAYRQLSGLCQSTTVGPQRLVEFDDTDVAMRLGGDNGRTPSVGGWTGVQHHVQVPFQTLRTIAVGFVDHEQVGNFHDSGLDGLDGVAAFRHQRQNSRIRRGRYIELRLTDAHRFDDDEVSAERVEELDDTSGSSGQPALMPSGRHAADKDAGVQVMLLHADAVTQNCPARKGTRRVNGDNTDRLALLPGVRREPVREGALAGARRARDPDTIRSSQSGVIACMISGTSSPCPSTAVTSRARARWSPASIFFTSSTGMHVP